MQLTMKGDVIPPEEHQFIWVEEIISKISIIPIDLPPVQHVGENHLLDLLSTLHGVVGRENLYSRFWVSSFLFLQLLYALDNFHLKQKICSICHNWNILWRLAGTIWCSSPDSSVWTTKQTEIESSQDCRIFLWKSKRYVSHGVMRPGGSHSQGPHFCHGWT